MRPKQVSAYGGGGGGGLTLRTLLDSVSACPYRRQEGGRVRRRPDVIP